MYLMRPDSKSGEVDLQRPVLIGITGSIGSGKSTVAALIAQQYQVVNADSVANEILDTPSCQSAIKERWGEDILKDSKADRKAIADIVFNNPSELLFLNQLVHPLVLEQFEQIVRASKEKYIFFEVPLLFEAGLRECFDFVLLISAGQEIRLQRVLKRGNQSEDEIRGRMAAQMNDEEKVGHSDLIIHNESDILHLSSQVSILLDQIQSITRRHIRPFL